MNEEVKAAMPRERWIRLMESNDLSLTVNEIADGWHFCGDWDGLLVGPGMPMEQECCTCLTEKARTA